MYLHNSVKNDYHQTLNEEGHIVK